MLGKLIHKTRVKLYPSVPLADIHSLPAEPGLYYVRQGDEILYIGMSTNMYNRWNWTTYGTSTHAHYGHHKMEELLEEQDKNNQTVHIHYCIIPNKHTLAYLEAREINRFKPRLNKRKESMRANLNMDVIGMLAERYLLLGGSVAALGGIALLLLL